MKRGLIALAAVASAFALAPLANATPLPVKAFYVYASSPRGLQHVGYYDGKRYAEKQPAGTDRVLMLDFGAARKVDSDTWGTLGFAGAYFANGDILLALERAADGYHDGNSSGRVLITYGNSNYHLSANGMGSSNTWYAGYYQSSRAKQLADYQASKVYSREGAAAGSDMEPSWEGPAVTRQLVNGETAHGFALYYNYGSADGCPWTGSSGSCNNGWDVGDAGYVSYHGMGWGLPEIYYTVNADQWTVIRRAWEASHADDFLFAGVTAGGALCAPDGLERARRPESEPSPRRAHLLLLRKGETMFGWISPRRRLALVAGTLTVAGAGALGGIALAGSTDAPPPADPIPAKMLGADVPVPISPALLRTTNGWVTSDGQTLTAVYAGAAGNDSSIGRFVVVRQDLDVGEQTVDSVDVGSTGAITITSAPLGSSVETSAQVGQLQFSSARGWTGSIDLGNNDAVESSAP